MIFESPGGQASNGKQETTVDSLPGLLHPEGLDTRVQACLLTNARAASQSRSWSLTCVLGKLAVNVASLLMNEAAK
eukprot:490212-Prorocentrum_lima.AAC.1